MGKVLGVCDVLVCRGLRGLVGYGGCVMADWNDEMMAIEAQKPANVKTLSQFMADQDKVKFQGKEEFRYFHDHAHELYSKDEFRWVISPEFVDETSKYNIGEVVIDVLGNRGIVAGIPTISYLDIIYPGYDVPQSMRALFVTKIQEAGDGQ
jgi:hypothetical protein